MFHCTILCAAQGTIERVQVLVARQFHAELIVKEPRIAVRCYRIEIGSYIASYFFAT